MIRRINFVRVFVNISFGLLLDRTIFFYIDDARTYDPVSIRIAAIIIFV